MTHYNIRSERSLLELFPTLKPAAELKGVYTPELPGPEILKPFKRLFLYLSGLPGWGGKQFFNDYALNLIQKNKETTQGPKMILSSRPSKADGKKGLVATYDKNAPFIWQRCTDEFRIIDSNTILGMSHFDLPGFRQKPIMFLLHRAPGHKGV